MSYYDDRKEILRTVSNWVYDDDREPWSELVRDLGLKFGVGETSCRKALKQLSRNKLYINDKGELLKTEAVE